MVKSRQTNFIIKIPITNRIMYVLHLGEILWTSEKQLRKYGSFR